VVAAPVFAAGVCAGLAAVEGFATAGGVEGEFAAGVCCAGVLAARRSPAAAIETAINVVLDIGKYCGIPGGPATNCNGGPCITRA
jgi:hypothetical protein